ncbi:hypothetical protein [Sedimentibacter sp. LTW-03]|uniref:hypothetical protein n=1 Tax=Sedimentibacter sp. LTW-03 TaxID=3453406 RepID=UPI003F8370B4
MFYVEDIKEFHLDEGVKYIVKDSIRCRSYICKLVFQADFIFLFQIIDKNVCDNKICISKIDYLLNRKLIEIKACKIMLSERKISV